MAAVLTDNPSAAASKKLAPRTELLGKPDLPMRPKLIILCGCHRHSNAGFTLVELVAVLIMMGILAAVAVPRYIDLDQSAKSRAIKSGISELNGRESLGWARVKTTAGGWQSDSDLFVQIDYNLGHDYNWVTGPEHGDGAADGGGTLEFQNSFDVVLGRVDSTLLTPAYWYRK